MLLDNLISNKFEYEISNFTLNTPTNRIELFFGLPIKNNKLFYIDMQTLMAEYNTDDFSIYIRCFNQFQKASMSTFDDFSKFIIDADQVNNLLQIKIIIKSNAIQQYFHINTSFNIKFIKYNIFLNSFKNNEAFYKLFTIENKTICFILNYNDEINLQIGNKLFLSLKNSNIIKLIQEFYILQLNLVNKFESTSINCNFNEFYIPLEYIYIHNLQTSKIASDLLNKLILELIRNFFFFISTSCDDSNEQFDILTIQSHKNVFVKIPKYIEPNSTSSFFDYFGSYTSNSEKIDKLIFLCKNIFNIYSLVIKDENIINKIDLRKHLQSLITFYLCSNNPECNISLFLKHIKTISNGLDSFKEHSLSNSISFTIAEAIELSKYIDHLALDLSDQISSCLKNLFANLVVLLGILFAKSLSSTIDPKLHSNIFNTLLLFSFLLNIPFSIFRIYNLNNRFQKIISEDITLNGHTFTKNHLEELGSKQYFEKHLLFWRISLIIIIIMYLSLFQIGLDFLA